MDLEAAKMAIEDFGGVMFGKPIELVSADALNKPDIAASIARKWWETEAVDMMVGLPTSATALAVMQVSKQLEKVMIVTGAASSDITGKSCSPYTAHWTYDTYGNAHTVGNAIVKNGGDTWFFTPHPKGSAPSLPVPRAHAAERPHRRARRVHPRGHRAKPQDACKSNLAAPDKPVGGVPRLTALVVLAINRENDLVAPPTGAAINPSTKTQIKALATSSPTFINGIGPKSEKLVSARYAV